MRTVQTLSHSHSSGFTEERPVSEAERELTWTGPETEPDFAPGSSRSSSLLVTGYSVLGWWAAPIPLRTFRKLGFCCERERLDHWGPGLCSGYHVSLTTK